MQVMVGSAPYAQEDDYEILPAGWRDLSGLQILQKEAFPEDAWPLWDVIGILTLPNITRLKAAVHGRMVGFLAAEYRPKDQAVWVAMVGVLPAYQKRGIGSALLEACEKQCGHDTVRLCVRLSNKKAQRLYLELGFFVARNWQGYYHDGEDALVMEKHLPGPRRK